MSRILLFNPPSALKVYEHSSVGAVIPKLASLSLAMIAGSAIEENIDVKIVDLMLYTGCDVGAVIQEEVSHFKPDIAGVTATTPLFYEAGYISDKVKSVSKHIITILGGPHASSLPLDCLKESSFDIVVAGEGERPVKEIIKGKSPKDVRGVYCRGHISNSVDCQKAESLPIDELPFPALGLFNARDYVCSKVIVRNNPVGPIEMSRGCPFNCSFCNKTVHGNNFRIKSVNRIIEELFILKKLGYREFHVLDDQFTTDIVRAKLVCEEIIRRDINMSWNLRTGVRVDRIDKEFLELAKKAGCYQAGIGFESGSQSALDAVGKGIKVDEALKAVKLIKEAGIEIAGFFMLGLPGETVESMEETVRFAIRLDPDYAKATILVPFPGTRIYDEYEEKGLIRTKDWSRYNFHNANEIYEHPTLDWKSLNYYYKLFHKRFYFRLKYIIKRAWMSLIKGSVFSDIYYAYKTFSGGGYGR